MITLEKEAVLRITFLQRGPLTIDKFVFGPEM